MDAESAKLLGQLIGGGLATIGVAGSGVGIGIIFGNYLNDIVGQVFVFFILTVVAAESAIGLAIIVVLFRNKNSIDVEDIGRLKG